MFRIGNLVVSTAGRDKNRMFLVVGVPDENHVLLCDGRLRKLSKPKLKKIKHIRPSGESDIVFDETVTDKKLYCTIKALNRERDYYAEG